MQVTFHYNASIRQENYTGCLCFKPHILRAQKNILMFLASPSISQVLFSAPPNFPPFLDRTSSLTAFFDWLKESLNRVSIWSEGACKLTCAGKIFYFFPPQRSTGNNWNGLISALYHPQSNYVNHGCKLSSSGPSCPHVRHLDHSISFPTSRNTSHLMLCHSRAHTQAKTLSIHSDHFIIMVWFFWWNCHH